MSTPVTLDRINPHQVNWADGRMFAMFTDAREAALFVEMTKKFCSFKHMHDDADDFVSVAYRYFTAHK